MLILSTSRIDFHSGEVQAVERRNKPKREYILKSAADAFDLPGEVLMDLPRVTVTGGQRVVVENHKGLMDYGPNAIIVSGGRVTLKLLGDNLELRAMNAQELLITGDIFNLEFVY